MANIQIPTDAWEVFGSLLYESLNNRITKNSGEYIKSIAISDGTMTIAKGDGTTIAAAITASGGGAAPATSTTAGVTKLYATTGNNTDGTMTQAAITSAIPSTANMWTKTEMWIE